MDSRKGRVEQIVQNYLRAISVLIKNGKKSVITELLSDGMDQDSNQLLMYQKENLSHEERMIIHTLFCLSMLCETYKRIIWNDFFLKRVKYKGIEWWRTYYSRSSYYRHRNHAIKEFVALCDGI